MKIALLSHVELEAGYPEKFAQAGFDIIFATTPAQRAELDADTAARVKAVLTIGVIGLSAAEIAALPALEMICAQGVGYERIDLDAAKQRNITVTNGPGTNNVSVADHTLALMLAITRNIAWLDTRTRQGEWTRSRLVPPAMTGKKLGIIGLGNIGGLIAERCVGGFSMQVGYFNRRPLELSEHRDWRYFPDALSLAEWADYLVVATPGGKETLKLVDAAVLKALGPKGYLINISRGSNVDNQALIHSLQQREIAGAALDVVDGEPQVPAEMIALTDNLILTPHLAGRSPESIANMMHLVLENLQAYFNQQPVLTPVA